MLRHLFNLLLWFLPPSGLFLFRRICLKLSQVEVARNASVCGRDWVYGRGRLHIGKDTWLSPGVIFYKHIEAPIIIGSNCDIGPGVEFITGGYKVGTSSRRAGVGTADPL